jgi:hypothetical protein
MANLLISAGVARTAVQRSSSTALVKGVVHDAASEVLSWRWLPPWDLWLVAVISFAV